MATRPLTGQPAQRDLDATKYNEAINRIKGNRFAAGSTDYTNNLNTIQSIGSRYGYKYQQYLPPTNQTAATSTGQWQRAAQGQTVVNPAASTNTQANTSGPTGNGPAATSNSYTTLPRDEAIRKYQEAVNRVKGNRFAAGSPEYSSNAQIIKDLGGKWGFNWQQHIGADWAPASGSSSTSQTTGGTATGTPATPTAPETPAPTTPDTTPETPDNFFNNYQSPMTMFLMKSLASNLGQLPAYAPGANPDDNTMRAYEPQFFEGSPMYQFQKQKGLADLEKLMASRGLTNSGAELQTNSDFLANINAQESEKQRGYAEAEAERKRRAIETETARKDLYDRDKATRTQSALNFISQYDQSERENFRSQYNTNTARQDAVSQFETGRKDTQKLAAMEFLKSILGLQAQNPIASDAFKGLGESSAYGQALMKAIASFTANDYTKVSAPSGNSGTLPPKAPMDTSNLDLAKILMGASNNADSNSVFNAILKSF